MAVRRGAQGVLALFLCVSPRPAPWGHPTFSIAAVLTWSLGALHKHLGKCAVLKGKGRASVQTFPLAHHRLAGPQLVPVAPYTEAAPGPTAAWIRSSAQEEAELGRRASPLIFGPAARELGLCLTFAFEETEAHLEQGTVEPRLPDCRGTGLQLRPSPHARLQNADGHRRVGAASQRQPPTLPAQALGTDPARQARGCHLGCAFLS